MFWHVYLRLGRGDIVGVNQYCEQTSPDTNTPTDFYLKLGSHKRNTIDWIIHLSKFKKKQYSKKSFPYTIAEII